MLKWMMGIECIGKDQDRIIKEQEQMWQTQVRMLETQD